MTSFTEKYQNLLRKVRLVDIYAANTPEYKREVAGNPDVVVWLDKVGHTTKSYYLASLCHFLRCVNIQSPTELLDLKSHEDVKKRFFPAERLVEVWKIKAREQGTTSACIKKTLDAVRSFFKWNRIPLVQVVCSYRPSARHEVSDDELRTFRDGFSWHGKILFDFLLSVPLRDGQFQKCKNCGLDFYPRWRHILSYPEIEPYSTFAIRPEKGHENANYSQRLMQVCFLTGAAARALRMFKEFKERKLGRELSPDEYIFTHQKNHRGPADIAPIGKPLIISIFQQAEAKTGVNLSPHGVRAWVNTILISRSIDKPLRDIYLGHSTAYEMGYLMQLIPKWQQTFREAKAMEHLDILEGVNSMEIERTQQDLDNQKRIIAQLQKELKEKTPSAEDMAFLRDVLAKMKKGDFKTLVSG